MATDRYIVNGRVVVDTGAETNSDATITGQYTFDTSPTFNQPLVLPNNSRINGVEHFYQETPPTTRGDGSALVDGDIWYKPGGDTVWIRKGIYWVSDVKTSFMGTSTTGFYFVVNSASGSLNWRNTLEPPFILETAGIFFYCSTQTDSLNYWDLTNCSFKVGDGDDYYYTPQSIALNDFYVQEHRLITFEANTFSSSPLNFALRFDYTRIGTVGLSGVLSGFINYRSVYA